MAEPEKPPFVVVAGTAKAEKPFATLGEAVAAAASGDAIEIRGNGPFVVQPIDLKEKALTLRAGSGFSPVLKLAPEAVQKDLPLLTTRAALVLEGLEFHRDGDGKPGAVSLKFIDSQRAPVAVANCRFVLRTKADPLIHAVAAEGASSVQIRNCLFLGNWHAGAALNWAPPGGRMVVANNLFVSRHSAVHVSFPDDEPFVSPAVVQLSNNTMVVNAAVNAQATLPAGPAQAQPNPKVRIEVVQNSCTAGLVGFVYFVPSKEDSDYLEREHRTLTRRFFALEDRGNQIAAGVRFAGFSYRLSGISYHEL